MGWYLVHSFLLSAFIGLFGHAGALKPTQLDFSVPVAQAAEAQAPALPAPPRKKDPDSLGVQLTAKSAALVDTRSGALLFSSGDDQPAPIASITKLMMALVFLDAKPDWNAKVTVIPSDYDMYGLSSLKVGDQMTVRQLWDATLDGSLNAGALALARTTGMTRGQFVAKMNSKALQLGMAHTSFADPSGYLPQNTSTALDVARLAYDAFASEDIREAVTRPGVDVRTAAGDLRHVASTDDLLDSFLNNGGFRIVGAKTGFTDEAGYTLVMRAQEGKGDLIAVVLGSSSSDDRFQDVKSLLAWGFRTFEW